MWSNVEEKIKDGTSGLSPKTEPAAVLVGTCSKGTVNVPVSLGKGSKITDILGYGALPRRFAEMQAHMSDVSVIAVPSEPDQPGTIGEVRQTGDKTLTVSGATKCAASVVITVITAGAAGSAEVNINITGDKTSFDKTGTEIVLIPENGTIALEDLGITLLFPTEGEFAVTDAWNFAITTPTSTFASLQTALDAALELYNPEFVFVCQTTTAADAVSWSSYMETLFTDKHQPLFALLETNLDSAKPLAEAVTAKIAEYKGVDARFVSVACQPLANKNSAAALCAGTLTQASVNQSIGATKYFGLSGLKLPEGWTNQISRSLDEARFITLRTYAGLNGLFWSNGRTLASDMSDYRFIEVVRTVFKAVRLARRASLPYIQAPGDASGLQALLAEVRAALTKMTAANPKELDDFAVDMPSGQDIVNNGVQLDIALYGIPIIRKIILNFMFKYNQEV